MTDPFMQFKAKLNCGAVIEFLQHERHMNMEITLEPPPGIPLNDVAQIKDGKLIIRSTVESFLGVFQIMQMMTGTRPRKKFLGIF